MRMLVYTLLPTQSMLWLESLIKLHLLKLVLERLGDHGEDEVTGRVFREGIIHTVAPYDSDHDRDHRLEDCYHNSISLATGIAQPRSPRLVTPLLGSGVKNISLAVSTEALLKAVLRLSEHQPSAAG